MDRNSYRSNSREELGIYAVMRRILQKNSFKLRIFEFYEWNKKERKHEKMSYCKMKMKKIPQNEEAIKKKYYYNY